MRKSGTHSADSRELRRCLRDLAALTALPAVWGGGDRRRLAAGLAEVAVKVACLDFAYVSLKVPGGRDAIEVAHSDEGPHDPEQAALVARALAPWLNDGPSTGAVIALPHPLAGDRVQAVITPIGYAFEFGVLVAASGRRGFPTEEERLLLGVAANQATLVLQRRQVEEALRAADRKKDEFLATLAHELRNPLAPIRNAVELMRRADGDGTLIEQSRGLMERQLGHMVRLVDDLLDVSRITGGKLQLRKEKVELAAVLRSAVEASRPLIEASGHEFALNLPPEPVLLDADPVRLAQVFSNLLNNAAKYTEKRGHIWLTADRRGGAVAVSVRDTGIGIGAEHLPGVFDMFSQVDSALERSQGGLGIGLALARGLIELHGGSIEARSDGAGRGSEFTVRLPVVEAPAKAPKEPGTNGETSRRGPTRRILVVDDNRDSADSLALLLRMMGNEVRTAHDGPEAVEAAAAFRPDVTLLDIGLPKLNGYDVARLMRKQPGGGDRVLIALTGWGQEEDRRRSQEAGFDYHMVKPVDPEALQQLLAALK